jgi:hypothetical protein
MALIDFTAILSTIILAIVASYGAVLSTINFLNERKKEKPQIIVDLYWGWGEGKYGSELLYITAKNTGWKTVTLDYILIVEYVKPKQFWKVWKARNDNKKNSKIASFQITSNNELLSGKCYEYKIDADDLGIKYGINSSMNLIAAYYDQIGNHYESNPIVRNT